METLTFRYDPETKILTIEDPVITALDPENSKGGITLNPEQAVDYLKAWLPKQ